jgi:hypothetical protein
MIVPNKKKDGALAAPPMFIPPAQKHQNLSRLETYTGILPTLQSELSAAIESLRADKR